MKNFFFIFSCISILIAGIIGSASCQVKGNKIVQEAVVHVGVEISETISGGLLEVKQGAAKFTYESLSDYSTPRSFILLGHLTVMSVRSYDILVKADGDFIGETDQTKKINLNALRLSASLAGTEKFEFGEITPSTNNTVLVKASPGTLSQSFDVQYKILHDPSFITLKKQVYTTTLIYSISAH